MPRPRPPYPVAAKLHGTVVPFWYVRRNGKRIRLRAEFGTPEFDAEYQVALAAHQPATEVRTTAGTLAWLIECFRGTAAWQARSDVRHGQAGRDISAGAQDGRQCSALGHNAKAYPRRPGAPIEDARTGAPLPRMRCARYFGGRSKTQLVKVDPTVGIEAPVRGRDAGIRPWTEEDVAAYEISLADRNATARMAGRAALHRTCGAAMPCGSGASTFVTA